MERLHRRRFVQATALAGAAALVSRREIAAAPDSHGPGFCNPAEAMKAERETVVYTTALYTGTDVKQPDFLATVDVDPKSATYGQVIHRLPMKHVGDELHHFGWNACSSCHGDAHAQRRFLLIPGQRSGRIYIADAEDPRAPKLHKVIEPETIKERTNLSAPHTVHCLANGQIMISMLGDRNGDAPGGFLLLDQNFDVVGRWEREATKTGFNYDFWYQPRHNVMVSSEWGAPNTYGKGFDLKDVEAGKYGRSIHFWDWQNRRLLKSVDLGASGMIPLEVRFHHNPASTHGFVGAALSSSMWHWHKEGSDWQVEKIIEVEPIKHKSFPFPVPGLITDLVLSMDDRFLYFSNWLHGDLRQYDVSNPSQPKLTGQVWLGGAIGKPSELKKRSVVGGPQMLQLSLDGRRLYVTNSLFSTWDNQFYPAMAKAGSFLVQIDCNTEKGGMKINEDFFVDFGKEPAGPARAHEIRYPGGDSTSDIFV